MIEGGLGELVAIEGYSIIESIGRGGMGTVYRGVQESLGRPVAIKVLGPALRGEQGFTERFRREASLQATLQHPNIIPAFESGEAQGIPYIVMRLVDGPSLRELIRAGTARPADLVELLTGIAAALDFAHERGVLHRDVKPHNILVECDQHAWLADFGLTRAVADETVLTSASGLVGTFDYLAPEIARGERATPASDVYSLAVTAFQTLTGSLPFDVTHHAAAVFAHASAPRPRASGLNPVLPAAVDAALARGMSVEAGDRQRTAGALLDDLREAFGLERRARAPAATPVASRPNGVEAPSSAGTVSSASAPSVRPKSSGRARRRRVAAAVAVALAAGAGALFLADPGANSHPSIRGYPEIVGGEAHNWTDYRTAGGKEGPLIPAYRTVQIACKLRGYRVQDGNRWWYQIASSPWRGHFYVSADAFYNNGQSHGTLRDTPFVDPRIPNC